MDSLDLEYGSQLFMRALAALQRLPGVGLRTAQRYALYLQSLPQEDRRIFIESLSSFLYDISYCPECRALSDDGDLCHVCKDPHRDSKQLCVVSTQEDMLAVERTGMYRGKYFILGGMLDPMHGVGEGELAFDALLELVERVEPREVILAFSSTPPGETTMYFLERLLSGFSLQLTEPARGLPTGESLSQTDGQTLYYALEARVPVSPLGAPLALQGRASGVEDYVEDISHGVKREVYDR